MTIPYIIIDNALDDPYKIIDYAKTLHYYSVENKPLKGINLFPADADKSKVQGHWIGYRSYPFHKTNKKLNDEIIHKLCEKILGKNLYLGYNINTYFHYTPDGLDVDYSSQIHIDESCLMAGILYLTPNPPKDSGTIIKINNEEIVIDNVFNRFILYNSHLLHRPQAGFGNSAQNARLTFLTFIHEITLGRK